VINNIAFENYKGMKRSHNLERLNLITGPNGSGKTAIGTAIHIAIKGKHPFLGENLQAIRKECSADNVIFDLTGDEISIRREFGFGDKTVHKVFVNGSEARVKEAQSEIDEVYPDSITRLDIGKFARMNDIERGQVLSELLGSAKELAEDISEEIVGLFFRENPESDYVIKYRLDGKFERKGFIAAMRELYADKNPVILETLDTCQKILGEKTGMVELAEYLDAAYEAVKKYRNAKGQEKQYAQKSFAEITTGLMPASEIEQGLEEYDKKYAQLDADMRKLSTLIDTLAALKPEMTAEKAAADVTLYTDMLEAKNALLATYDAQEKKLVDSLSLLQNGMQVAAAYDAWEDRKKSAQARIDGLKTGIENTKVRIKEESKAKLKALEQTRVDYLSLKDLNPGECPTCGTIIPDEAAADRKRAIKLAKAAWAEADAEIKLRNENAMFRSQIELLEKQLADETKILAEENKNPFAKPKKDRAALAEEEKALLKQRNEINAQKTAVRKEQEPYATVLAEAKAEQQKHDAYAKALAENKELLSLYEADPEDPMPALVDAHGSMANEKHKVHMELVKCNASKQLADTVAKDQERILDLQVAFDTLGVVAEIIRKYKNDSVQKKIEPVQLLAKKYYHDPNDEIVLTPRSIGINRNGIFIEQSALSAGESLSLMSAVLIAIIESSGYKPNYLFVDAAEIDAKNIGILIDALGKSGLDCVIVAHHMPLDTPNGWTHIKL
jgi:DNA repair exonuclease SbcCD ATPase subunit